MNLRTISAPSDEQNMSQIRAHTRGGETDSCWKLEPHCCRVCFGRVASFKTSDGLRMYQCTNCGMSEPGHKPSVICACGLKIRKAKGDGRTAAVLVDAGIRCHENKSRTPDFPSLYVASYGGAQAET